MDASHFDTLVRSFAPFASRRRFTRTFVTSALAAVLASLGVRRETVAACRHNGARCRQGIPCCSGACKKKKHEKRRCRPTPGARGCTIESPCDETHPCAGMPFTFCVITLGGKPFCASGGVQECADCTSDAECEAILNHPGTRCAGCPGHCSGTNFRICVGFEEV